MGQTDHRQTQHSHEGTGLYHLQGYQLRHGGQTPQPGQGTLQQNHGKPHRTQRIQFAKDKSDIIAKLDGTFQLRDRPENYHHIKYQEKFVLRPQQIRAKAEREKNFLKKAENVTTPFT